MNYFHERDQGLTRGKTYAERAAGFIHFVNKSSMETPKIAESSATCNKDGSL